MVDAALMARFPDFWRRINFADLPRRLPASRSVSLQSIISGSSWSNARTRDGTMVEDLGSSSWAYYRITGQIEENRPRLRGIRRQEVYWKATAVHNPSRGNTAGLTGLGRHPPGGKGLTAKKT
jgi:hypothetical protein